MESLQQLYKDSGSPSRTKFIDITRKLRRDGKLTASPTDVVMFLDSTSTAVFDDVDTNETKHYDYPAYDYALIIDLMDMNNISSKNHGYNWILNILEYHSRFVWSFPLKTKSSTEAGLTAKDSNPIAASIQSVLEQIDPDRTASIRLVSDLGGEFKGEVSKMLKDYPWVFRLYTIPGRRTSTMPVERFNRTLRDALKRVMATNNNLNWTDELSGVINRYNASHHEGLNDIPVDKLLSIKHDLDQGISHAVIKLDSLPELKYPVGSLVRIKLKQSEFAKKSFVPKTSSEVYKVIGFKHTLYQLEPVDGGEPVSALEKELRLVPKITKLVVDKPKPKPIHEQLSEEQSHARQQRKLKDILPKKSLDTIIAQDEHGREVVRLKPSRLPKNSRRDKSAAIARMKEQSKH